MGCATNVIKPLQQVQNWAARLVLGAPRSDPATPLLRTLHWLPVSERIKYKVGCMCFNVVTNNAPGYLTELLPLYSNLEKLRSSMTHGSLQEENSDGKLMAIEHLSVTLQLFGIVCRITSDILHLSRLSNRDLKRICSTSISEFAKGWLTQSVSAID